ncbi:nucleotidyltransferase family protein [Fluviispira multicolorata]|uniref:Nucleotidyl transferase domain-containing protein n=1 Tax=Fluviispira multicolorata TaxID=2654512 RepID=A0A833JF55_9BACT|nr:sugar phosphate nucleotidyltransferase [Fluviispira multicolorata]KAB8030865.1 hypothetical protein GCL57_07780 [Fluviispira multicolorata]
MTHKIDTNKYIPIVLCAGFGKRLKPLTRYLPKVVCPILDTPISFMSIELFFNAGFEKVHCNTHYLSEEVKNELQMTAQSRGYDPTRIVFWHEDELLDTGGGIARIFHELAKKDSKNIEKDLIIVSGDIAAQFPINNMIDKWEKRQSDELALMCTKELNYFRKDATWVSKDLKYILGFGEKFQSDEEKIARLFTNHQILSHNILQNTPVEKKSSIDLYYRSVLANKFKVIHLDYPIDNYWFDIGTPKQYLECIQYFDSIDKKLTNNIVINNTHYTPKLIKEKINKFLLENPNFELDKESLSQKIIICLNNFGHKKNNIFIPLNFIEENEGDNNFILCIKS